MVIHQWPAGCKDDIRLQVDCYGGKQLDTSDLGHTRFSAFHSTSSTRAGPTNGVCRASTHVPVVALFRRKRELPRRSETRTDQTYIAGPRRLRPTRNERQHADIFEGENGVPPNCLPARALGVTPQTRVLDSIRLVGFATGDGDDERRGLCLGFLQKSRELTVS